MGISGWCLARWRARWRERLVESGAEAEIIIARNGRPAARLLPIQPVAAGKRIGVAKGRFLAPMADEDDATIIALFEGSAG